MDPEEFLPSPVAPPLPGPVLLTQDWRDVVFLHWPVPPESVAHLLPPGTRPDVLGGVTYVGIVAFRVTGTHVLGRVPVGRFNEFNVRLYSVDDRGRRGVVFMSLDADSPHNVAAARLLAGLRYMWAGTSIGTGPEGRIGYACLRRCPGPRAATRFRVRPGDPVARPSPMEVFVTARWGLHTRVLGGTRWVRIAHQPWRLHRAELTEFRDSLVGAAGIAVGERPPPSVLWSPGVDAAVSLGADPTP
ncbi:hypothetical protein HDA32_006017 [Spinactinospora alkalitolerans]|uniref:DUF2071 domain-containing protein n=1 Tax=Spinactinospora alkalitolerans TaxID=687207 RepID=A0A852U5K1_9ACTN|nr:DUF2071 domain-containing protein [Spinactinospora alkalitolerans]NYE50897.1 hypothetical protein [Spinactinospora alkalitolerans]